MFTFLRRVIRFGWHNFWRAGGLNIATVFVLIVTLTLITCLFISEGAVNHIMDQIKEKIDISVYMTPDTSDEEIELIKNKLVAMPEVQEVKIVSKEDAMNQFREKHQNDPVLLESLDIVGTNPFYASLDIKAKNPEQYAAILEVINSDSLKDVVYKVDYVEKKTVIEKLSGFITNVNTGGLALALALGVVAVLVAFNTIRVAIYDASKEISIMRLVGASNSFIRGPFIVQGIISGAIAALASFIILLLMTYFLAPKIESLTSGFNVFSWFISRAFGLFFLQLVSGIALGVISSLIAIRKYLTA
ncbi:MAG: permease-like cell division protein FtsX [Candidatus Parcubacteria bacterium]|nr:permease-like cell division protein FtsX [Candidatus Parcubacteria bacterium]